MSSDLMEKFWSAPPVSRTLVAAMFVESALVYSGLLSSHRIIYYNPWIFKFPPELWRLMSSFLLTGSGFNFVWDLYFSKLGDTCEPLTLMLKAWTYGSGLELNSARFSQPGDFFVYVVFVAAIIVVSRPPQPIFVPFPLAIIRLSSTSHICPPSQYLAEAVPGNEEDYPCGTCSSVIRKAIKDCVWFRHGGGFFEKAMRGSSICVRRLEPPTKPFAHSHTATTCSLLLSFKTNTFKVTSGLLLQSLIFTSSLLMALIYTFAQDNRGKKAHFILFQIPVELLPWAMLTLTLIMGGPAAALQQGTGVVAAHLYDFLTRLYPIFQGGRNFIQTPMAIKRYFGAGSPQYTNRGYGQAYRPAQTTQQPQSRGWTSGFSNSWSGRGAGRRLGGD